MDFLNQDCNEGITEPLIDFNINNGSNQGMVITNDAREESCHERERGECSEQPPMVNPRRPHSGVNIHNRTKN